MATLTDRGLIFGVALLGGTDSAYLVSLSCEGELFVVESGSRRQLVRRALDYGWRVYASVGCLVDALHRGLCFGAVERLRARLPSVPLGSADAPYAGAL